MHTRTEHNPACKAQIRTDVAWEVNKVNFCSCLQGQLVCYLVLSRFGSDKTQLPFTRAGQFAAHNADMRILIKLY
jgi:hypothetical protein